MLLVPFMTAASTLGLEGILAAAQIIILAVHLVGQTPMIDFTQCQVVFGGDVGVIVGYVGMGEWVDFASG